MVCEEDCFMENYQKPRLLKSMRYLKWFVFIGQREDDNFTRKTTFFLMFVLAFKDLHWPTNLILMFLYSLDHIKVAVKLSFIVHLWKIFWCKWSFSVPSLIQLLAYWLAIIACSTTILGVIKTSEHHRQWIWYAVNTTCCLLVNLPHWLHLIIKNNHCIWS